MKRRPPRKVRKTKKVVIETPFFAAKNIACMLHISKKQLAEAKKLVDWLKKQKVNKNKKLRK